MKKFEVLSDCDAIRGRNRFYVCVAQKFCWNRDSFHMNPKTESNKKLFFPSFFVNKDTSLHIVLLVSGGFWIPYINTIEDRYNSSYQVSYTHQEDVLLVSGGFWIPYINIEDRYNSSYQVPYTHQEDVLLVSGGFWQSHTLT